MNSNCIQSFAYEIKNGKATIFRCFSGSDIAIVPEMLEGCPVTNIAPYAFSAGQNLLDLKGKKISAGSESDNPAEDLPQLCGLSLTGIVLPDSVQRLGRYCFYNCENLKSLEFSGNVKDWGAGTFTGCHQISNLKVHVLDEGRSTLKDVLADIPEEVEVDYVIRSSASDEVIHTRLIFPEYFEEGVENTPARILETKIHGSGMRYRNCFVQKVFKFQEYDSCFAYAVAQEDQTTVIRMAIDRLKYPGQITEEAIATYRNYLISESVFAASYILGREDQELLSWFASMLTGPGGMDSKEKQRQILNQIRTMAGERQNIAAVSFLMDYEHKLFASQVREKRRNRSSRFEL